MPRPCLQLDVTFAGVEMDDATKLPEKSFTMRVLSPNGAPGLGCLCQQPPDHISRDV